jgi:hypothetical protein
LIYFNMRTPIGKLYIDVFRKIIMSSMHNVALRLVAAFLLAISSFATAAEAQPYHGGQGGSGNMMGGGWGWAREWADSD